MNGEEVMLIVGVRINQRVGRALVDTGCQQSVVSSRFCERIGTKPYGPQRLVCMLNRETTRCAGHIRVEVEVEGHIIQLMCLVVQDLVCGVDMILGLEGITQLGGMTMDENRNVRFGKGPCVAVGTDREGGKKMKSPCVAVGAEREGRKKMKIEDTDFLAEFDGMKWVISWKWKECEPMLTNNCGQYAMDEESRKLFEEEVDQWIDDGWLELYQADKHGEVGGVIPLMAAKQPNKPKKIRPVLDYRELNEHVISRPGQDTAICQEKLRKWRVSGDASLLDLKKAYLQIHVVDELKKFQAVKYKGQLYIMTRMGLD